MQISEPHTPTIQPLIGPMAAHQHSEIEQLEQAAGLRTPQVRGPELQGTHGKSAAQYFSTPSPRQAFPVLVVFVLNLLHTLAHFALSLHKPISVSRIRIYGAVVWPVRRSLRIARFRTLHLGSSAPVVSW